MTIETNSDQDTTTTADAPAAPDTERRSGLDALNEALDGKTDTAGDSGDASAASGEVEAPAADGGEPEGEAASEAKEASDGEGERGSEGAPSKEEGEGKKEPDHINDPIPDDLKGRTRERMESLVKAVKERDEQLARVTAQRDELINTIRETGATPEQVGRMLSTLKLLNSPSIEDKKRGLAMLREDVESVAVLLGEDLGAPDLLDRYEDLKRAVELGEIDQKYARELALTRERDKRMRESAQHNEQLTRQQQEELRAANEALDALGRELQADPDYERKCAILIPRLRQEFARIPPRQWAPRFAAEYAKLKLPDQAKPTAQPLRPQQPAAPVKREPKTGLEAVNFALEELARRRA